jgi:hypothetical protein
MLKERFKKFNDALEAIYVQQSAWTIPEASLRSAVKRVIKQDLLPPYQAFLARWVGGRVRVWVGGCGRGQCACQGRMMGLGPAAGEGEGWG